MTYVPNSALGFIVGVGLVFFGFFGWLGGLTSGLQAVLKTCTGHSGSGKEGAEWSAEWTESYWFTGWTNGITIDFLLNIMFTTCLRNIKVAIPTSFSVGCKERPTCDAQLVKGLRGGLRALNMVLVEVAICVAISFGVPSQAHVISWAHLGLGKRRLLIPENTLANFLRLGLVLLELDELGEEVPIGNMVVSISRGRPGCSNTGFAKIVEESPFINPVIPERDDPAREGWPKLIRALICKASSKALDSLGSHDSSSRI